MKKFLTITILNLLIFSSPVLAKTEGHYIGIDIINTELMFDRGLIHGYSVGDEEQSSFSVNYKYVVNFNDIFIGLGVFFDYSNLRLKDNDGDIWNLDYRHGSQLNLGYDLTDKFAVFALVSLVSNRYEVNWMSINKKHSAHDIAVGYGGGIKYSISDNLDIDLSYEISEVNMVDPNVNKQDLNLAIFKLGTSYNF